MTKKPSPWATAPESRAEAAAPTPRQVIPDGCNLGVVLRVLGTLTGALLLLALALGGTLPQSMERFGLLATFCIPVALLTLVGWCLLRRLLPPLKPVAQRTLAWALPALLTLFLVDLLGAGLLGDAPVSRLGLVVMAAAVGAACQHYLELRARAFSPAMAEARFQALQSRIRPHFFFNSLNAAISVVRSDPPRAERMLESIAELHRAVMADVRKLVPLEQELDLCRKYVEIEQTRLGERLQVDWQIGAVHPRAKVPQLLLQPIIENAVRYGAEKIAGACRIEVRIRQHGFTLEISVANPIAREPVQREGNQIGLTNIRGRLALIYDLEAKLDARIRRDRFELMLTLPVEAKP